MSDIEERPSKIRKLESEDPKNSYESPSVLISHDKKEREESSGLAVEEDKETPHAENQVVAGENPPLSKNQLKKLRKQELWEAGKEYRKTKRREKHKERQARKAAEAQEAANSDTDAPEEIPPANDNKQRPRRPIQVPITLIMDCDFTELMTEKELISLGSQLTRCYSDNKASPYRSHMVVSSWGGALKTRFETVLTNHHLNWKGVRFLEEDFQDAAEVLDAVMRGPEGGRLVGALSEEQSKTPENKSGEYPTEKAVPGESPIPALNPLDPITQESETATVEKETENTVAGATAETTAETTVEATAEAAQENPEPSIVYLTSDSPHTLDVLSPNTSYIIGGIVDKNRHKGICYKRACERGIPTAKLPIGEYMTMQSRTVLAVNHVVEIMLKWLETGDWGEAFLSVIPKRKEAKLKLNKNGEAEDVEAMVDGEDAEAEVGGRDEEQTVEGVIE